MSPKPASQALRRRSSRSLPATITAVVLLSLAAAAVWVGISRLVTGSWPPFLSTLREGLSTLTWNSPAIWAAATLLLLLGIVLLGAAVLPGKHTTVRLLGPAGADLRFSETVITRRGLTKITAAHLDQADGVDSTSVRATAKKIDVVVRTPLHNSGDLSKRLRESLTRKLERIGLDPVPTVVVRVRNSED
ncbi:DUF6286 domain-containing protein [Arthrobacter sp. TMN-50]